MQSIYKYPLEITEEQTIELPTEVDILSVVSQRILDGEVENLVLYALVNTNRKFEKQLIDIKIIGTGHKIDINDLDGYTFLNTVQQYKLMWHIYYKKDLKGIKT